MTLRKSILTASVFVLGGIFSFNANSHAQVVNPGGSGGSSGVCQSEPLGVNLSPSDVKVEYINSQPQVTFSWSLGDLSDPFRYQKQEVFLSYLVNNPPLGIGENKLKNAYAQAFYDNISKSTHPTVQMRLKQALMGTMETTNILEGLNIKNSSTDFYPYIFKETLKSETELANALVAGLQEGLNGELLDFSQTFRSVGAHLKQVNGRGSANQAVSCVAQALSGVSTDQFKTSSSKNVYGAEVEGLKTVIESIQTQEKVQPLLEAIKNDRELVAQTKLALNGGIQTVMEVWSNNTNVQELIKLYQHDPEMKRLVDAFFATDLGKEVQQCVNGSYGTELKSAAQKAYLNLIEPRLSSTQRYDPVTTELVLAAQKTLTRAPEAVVKEEVSKATLKFINDYLQLEEQVADVHNTRRPFGDFYKAEMKKKGAFPEELTLDIIRDGRVIETLNNPNITQYVDRDIAQNQSTNIVRHEYSLVARNQCNEVSPSDTIQVALNPNLAQNTPVQVYAEVEIRLKQSQTEFFMHRLKLLLEALNHPKNQDLATTVQLEPLANPACEASRGALLETKTTDKLFSYILNCFGDGQINDALQVQMEGIVTPLIRFLELNQFSDTDQITANFLAPIIQLAREEYQARMELLPKIQGLAPNAASLSTIKDFEQFSADQKQWIKCGGTLSCDLEVQNLMEKYLLGASHSADIIVEVYDETGNIIRTQPAHTDIFGVASRVSLGELKAGMNYEIKVKLNGEPYTLPKISQIQIFEARPLLNGQFEVTIPLKTSTAFFFGNFDNTNDVIDLKDIETWTQFVEQDPLRWSEYNVDGFTGLDLFDASLFQNNWGLKAQEQNQTTEITLQKLLTLFGYNGGDDAKVYTPGWLWKMQ